MKPNFYIGSLPFQTPEEAFQFIDTYSSEFPFLPQLPEANPGEDMIAQMLRAMELGKFDAESSLCFAPFFEKYKSCEKVKIQLAGPFVVSRVISRPYDEVFGHWIRFWTNFKDQLEQIGFKNELWVQVDEPFWKEDTPLPEGYGNLICSIRGSRPKTKAGIHSCGLPRPLLETRFATLCDFLSFDFSQSPMKTEESKLWKEIWSLARTRLVVGLIDKGKPTHWNFPFTIDDPKIYVSPPCGLATWSPSEIEETFR